LELQSTTGSPRPRADLEQRLREAVRRENFALASILRDELRQISG
jgi:protein-arginine kinase activator protein McsA